MRVPSPGESITEVEIATWLVEDGEYVEKDQPIAEVDSDKATLELPAEESGIITLFNRHCCSKTRRVIYCVRKSYSKRNTKSKPNKRRSC